MAGRQRSLGLIPATLVKPTGLKPPMTSKAAKKAYQQANRMPRMSRAEHRRLEMEEIKRLNNEYEKERAAAKAKIARDKKAEKAKAEKEARRKIGLPEPSRHVRPSQPTISLFVRNGSKRTWQEMESVAEDSEGSVDMGRKDNNEPLQPEVRKNDDSGDEFGDFPSLSQSDLLETIESSISSAKTNQSISSVRKRGTPESLADNSTKELPRDQLEYERPSSEDANEFNDMTSTQLLAEAAEALCKSEDAKQTPSNPLSVTMGKSQAMSNPSTQDASSFTAQEEATSQKLVEPRTLPRPSLGERSINMPPPPARFQTKQPLTLVQSPPKHHPPLRKPSRPVMHLHASMPPSSTQIFIEDNLEDFYPSPTQELRELHDESKPVLPRKWWLARHLSTPGKETSYDGTDKENTDPLLNFICTQDLAMSSQDLLEITTPNRTRPTISAKAEPTSTTDLPPITALPTHLIRKPMAPLSPSIHCPKRPFFEEKEEDLLFAALHESKLFAANQVRFEGYEHNFLYQEAENLAAAGEYTTSRMLQRTQSTATDYGDDEFSGCSQELLALC